MPERTPHPARVGFVCPNCGTALIEPWYSYAEAAMFCRVRPHYVAKLVTSLGLERRYQQDGPHPRRLAIISASSVEKLQRAVQHRQYGHRKRVG